MPSQGGREAAVAAAAGLVAATVISIWWRRRRQRQSAAAAGAIVTVGRGARRWLRLAAERMRRVAPPRQSQFRVYCIITYVDDASGGRGWVSGTNSESAFIGGSLCAERSAAVQLREMPSSVRVTAIYLVSDMAATCISPGVLCREYLMSCCAGANGDGTDTPVFLASASLEHVRHTSLFKLLPCHSLYVRVGRDQVGAVAEDFVARMQPATTGALAALALDRSSAATAAAGGDNDTVVDPSNQAAGDGAGEGGCSAPAAWLRLLQLAKAAVAHDSFGQKMHPVQYGAAMAFSDGTTAVAWQKAGLEYGTTVDAVTGLLREVDAAKLARGAVCVLGPLRLVHVDQWGILHAPFAPARAQLFERGGEAVEVLVHDVDTARLSIVTVADLVPDCPSMQELWGE